MVRGPVPTSFQVNDRSLQVPYYHNASVAVERKMPLEFFVKAGLMWRSGSRSFVFETSSQATRTTFYDGVVYQLRNTRRERYDAVDFTVRRTFAGQFEWFAGYHTVQHTL